MKSIKTSEPLESMDAIEISRNFRDEFIFRWKNLEQDKRLKHDLMQSKLPY